MEFANHREDLVVLHHLLGDGSADIRLVLRVVKIQPQLAPHDAALGVEIGDRLFPIAHFISWAAGDVAPVGKEDQPRRGGCLARDLLSAQ